MEENEVAPEETPVDETETETPEETKPEELPQWARDSLKKANDEAAGYRVKLREAENKLAGLIQDLDTLTKERDSLVYGSKDSEREFLKLKAALKAKIPGEVAIEIAERLKGETLEELTKDAAKLRDMFPANTTRVKPTDHTQGMAREVEPAQKEFGHFLLDQLKSTKKR